MYTVVDFKLPEGLSLKIGPVNDFFRFEPQEGECDRKLSIPVPDSGNQGITISTYLVGERILLRKSMHGLRVVRGLPDYTGQVERSRMGPHIPQMVETLKKRHLENELRIKELRGGRGIFQSNLCQEVVLPDSLGSPPGSFSHFDQMRERIQRMATEAPAQVTPNRNEASRRFTDLPTAADFDGDTRRILDFETLITRPRTSGPRGSMDEFNQLQQYMTYARSNTGFTISRRLDRIEEPGPAPEYSQVPTAPVSLARAADAVAEVVTGQRGTPPASRGPRPRNQRW